jgi:asparagine N-glycosylation enzyme membrane subunit Stt3
MAAEVTLEVTVKVKRAANLLWASAALVVVFIVAVLVGLITMPGNSSLTGLDIVINIVTFGVLALLANRISNRSNWARWVLAVIAGLGAVGMVFSIVVAPEMWRSASLSHYGIALLQTILQMSALVLVFTSSSRAWFARNAAV